MRYTRLVPIECEEMRVSKKKPKSRAARKAPKKLVSLEKSAAEKRAASDTPAEKPKVDETDSAPLALTDEATLLARIGTLEADRTNLTAQVAWARAVAQEQQKALEVERERAAKLATDLEAQRDRVERLKALSALDRLLGRHKSI